MKTNRLTPDCTAVRARSECQLGIVAAIEGCGIGCVLAHDVGTAREVDHGVAALRMPRRDGRACRARSSSHRPPEPAPWRCRRTRTRRSAAALSAASCGSLAPLRPACRRIAKSRAEASVIYDFCVIGGGIVGLATAMTLLERRPGASLLLLEKEPEVAQHQTGHNSGVIHAGIYYEPGSLKAKLCRAGLAATTAVLHRAPVAVRDLRQADRRHQRRGESSGSMPSTTVPPPTGSCSNGSMPPSCAAANPTSPASPRCSAARPAWSTTWRSRGRWRSW